MFQKWLKLMPAGNPRLNNIHCFYCFANSIGSTLILSNIVYVCAIVNKFVSLLCECECCSICCCYCYFAAAVANCMKMCKSIWNWNDCKINCLEDRASLWGFLVMIGSRCGPFSNKFSDLFFFFCLVSIKVDLAPNCCRQPKTRV